MSWRAWVRIVLLTVLLLFVWATANGYVKYRIARSVTEERRAEAEWLLIDRMNRAGRELEEIKAAVEALNRRYKQ